MKNDMAPDIDTPITLKEACRIVFQDKITPATLRAEARRGRLIIESIGNKHFTTLAYIEEMRIKCRRPADQQETGLISDEQHESSSLEERKVALAAARLTLKGLKDGA